MVNVRDVDASTTMLVSKTSLPLYITAAGHPDGEVCVTKAAQKTDMRRKHFQEELDEIQRNATEVVHDEGAARATSKFIYPSLCWDDIAWFKSINKIPILTKGI
jgi:isopentenyl diphosphate isomerase/L-lactate dehydrogenase-like FMN-dependent dehydrogenase